MLELDFVMPGRHGKKYLGRAQKELLDCACIGRRTSTSLPDRSCDDVGIGDALHEGSDEDC
jgi:hypothetical protein